MENNIHSVFNSLSFDFRLSFIWQTCLFEFVSIVVVFAERRLAGQDMFH